MDLRETRVPRLAVLLSGTGRTLEHLIALSGTDQLPATIACVISSRSGVRGLEVADQAGIEYFVIKRTEFASDLAFSTAIFDTVRPFDPQLLILAGFLRKIMVPTEWEGRILNIHPALLPESPARGRGYYGDYVHRAVLASGASESGATVHLVNNEYDGGRVLMQRRVPVLLNDTVESLASRVFEVEKDLYPAAIRHWLMQQHGSDDPCDPSQNINPRL